MARKAEMLTAVADFETDPFLFGRKPEPFSCGFYDGETYKEFWGKDCALQLIVYIKSLKGPRRIYMHNGGKFDFFYLLEYLENPIRIINGRIVQAQCGIHEFRDSYAILPMPLKGYQKDDIDYALFEENVRENHKAEILKYLKADCVYLFDLVSAFVKRFGPKLTVGGTAISQFEKLHDFQHGSQEHDERFRKYYFGGRVQAFKTGRFSGPFRVFDVNSMYPHAMRNYSHPISTSYVSVRDAKIDRNGEVSGFRGCEYFAHVRADNRGVLPTRTKDGLDFNCESGEFFATSHELRVALRLGRIRILEVIEVLIPNYSDKFVSYVDTFYAEKVASKAKGDKINEIFSKLMLNSAAWPPL